MAAQNNADPRSDDGGVDYPTPGRHHGLQEDTAVAAAAQNNTDPWNVDVGVDHLITERSPSAMPQCHPQASPSPEQEFSSYVTHSLLRLDPSSNQERAYQSNVGRHSSSVDPVTPTRLGRHRHIIPVADSGTSHRPSRIGRLLSEQMSPVKELKGHDFMERGQRHVQHSGLASVGASISRAPEAHLEDSLGKKLVVRDSTLDIASASRARKDYWLQSHGVVGERPLHSPSLQPRRQSLGYLSPDLAPLTVANSSQGSGSTANALIREHQVARRRSYKEALLETTRTWPGPPTEALVRSLIKLDDEHDDRRMFVEPEKLHKDWGYYEIYARIGRCQDSNQPFAVYGDPLFRDLDILKLWVNLNEHVGGQTWPPGYTPQFS